MTCETEWDSDWDTRRTGSQVRLSGGGIGGGAGGTGARQGAVSR